MSIPDPDYLISPKEACRRADLSRASVWRLEKAGQFPARVQISPGRVGYFASAVDTWIASRPIVTAAA